MDGYIVLNKGYKKWVKMKKELEKNINTYGKLRQIVERTLYEQCISYIGIQQTMLLNDEFK